MPDEPIRKGELRIALVFGAMLLALSVGGTSWWYAASENRKALKEAYADARRLPFGGFPSTFKDRLGEPTKRSGSTLYWSRTPAIDIAATFDRKGKARSVFIENRGSGPTFTAVPEPTPEEYDRTPLRTDPEWRPVRR